MSECPLSPEIIEWAEHHFDPADSVRLADPYPVFDWLRENAPVAHSDAYEADGFWLVSRYEDVKTVVMDSETFECGPSLTIPAAAHDLPLYPEEANGERHARLRALANVPLTRAAIAENRYEEKSRAIVAAALERLRTKGSGDAVADVALDLPARLMFQTPLLGAPDAWGADWLAELRTLLHDLKYVPARSTDAAKALQANVELLFQERRRNPADDIPTRL
jgi:cytochrome P450